MENQTRNGLIAVAFTLSLVAGGVYLYRKYNGASENGNEENFNELINNLGGSVKPDKNMILTVPFNDKKNIANFYNNSRVVVFENNKAILKGNYYKGGKRITLDGGVKNVSSESVYENLNNLMIK